MSGKRPATGHAPKGNANEGRSSVTLNASALGSVIAEALRGSPEGLSDAMTTGFSNLGELITAYSRWQWGSRIRAMRMVQMSLRSRKNHL